MKEIKYQQKYVRQLVGRGTGTCFTPLPRADGKGGDLILRGGYPMAISLL